MSCKSRWSQLKLLQPGLIRRIHAAQIFWVSRQLNKLAHFVALIVIEVGEDCESLHYLVCAFVDDCYDVFDVDLAEAFVLREIFVGIDGLGVHDLLAVNGDDLIAKNRSDDCGELLEEGNVEI